MLCCPAARRTYQEMPPAALEPLPVAEPFGVSAGLAARDLRALFGPPAVRVMLDWDALERLDAPVTVRALTSLEQVEALYTPWYVEAGVGEVSFRDTDARPLRVGEITAHLEDLAPERVAAFDDIAVREDFRGGPLVVPCYGLPDGDLLLLDGNHRMGATARHRLPVRAVAVVVHGPVDPAILPDLAAWAPTRASS